MTFGKTIFWSVLSVVVASVIPAVPWRSPWSRTSHQGSMTKAHTETTQTITETINSMDYSTAYQYSATGSGVEPIGGKLSPTTGDTSVTINGVNSTWKGITATPQFKQTTPGAAFQFTETYADLVYKIIRSSKGRQRLQA